MSSSIYDKLDALLSTYYADSTTQGEKDNAKSLYEKLCKKNNINHDEYRNKSRLNPNNANQRSSRSNYGYQSRRKSESDFEEFVRDIFRRAAEQKAREARESAERQKRQDEDRRRREDEARRYQESEQKRKWEESQRNRWDNGRWGTQTFEMKSPLWEVKIHNGKRVILFNTLSRKIGETTRFGTQNFCLYSNTFDPDKWFADEKMKDGLFIVQSGKTVYFRDHYIVEKIWYVDQSTGEMIEIPLY